MTKKMCKHSGNAVRMTTRCLGIRHLGRITNDAVKVIGAATINDKLRSKRFGCRARHENGKTPCKASCNGIGRKEVRPGKSQSCDGWIK